MILSKTKSNISKLLSEMNGEFLESRVYSLISSWPVQFDVKYGLSTSYYFSARSSICFSYSYEKFTMVFYEDSNNVLCPLISFDLNGDIILGKALGDVAIETYKNWKTPNYKILKEANIDIEVYQNLRNLYIVFEPIIAQLYSRKLGQIPKNMI